MPIFKSLQPPIESLYDLHLSLDCSANFCYLVPLHLPVWTWLFDSDYSPLQKHKPEDVNGFTNVVTKEVSNGNSVLPYTTIYSDCTAPELPRHQSSFYPPFYCISQEIWTSARRNRCPIFSKHRMVSMCHVRGLASRRCCFWRLTRLQR